MSEEEESAGWGQAFFFHVGRNALLRRHMRNGVSADLCTSVRTEERRPNPTNGPPVVHDMNFTGETLVAQAPE